MSPDEVQIFLVPRRFVTSTLYPLCSCEKPSRRGPNLCRSIGCDGGSSVTALGLQISEQTLVNAGVLGVGGRRIRFPAYLGCPDTVIPHNQWDTRRVGYETLPCR
jgi:hypothetical protein